MARRTFANPPLFALSASLMLCGFAGCAAGFNPDDFDGGPPHDTGAHDSGLGHDADTGPHVDANVDTGPPHDSGPGHDAWAGNDASQICGTTTCTGFTHCVSGSCQAYPMCRGDGTCPTPGDVCAALRCVPGNVDIDGDGSPASMDCDETDPTRSPLAPEICNNRDDNCNGLIDDGDPTALCASNPAHGICMAGGICGCPAGTADIDLTVPGCECTIHPAPADGTDCTSPISMGTVFDEASGGPQTLTAMGNALPSRVVWYRFHATDVADTTCDTYHVRVQLTVNPANAYNFQVTRGMCGAASSCPDCTGTCAAFNDYEYRTDMAGAAGLGQCPCQTTPSTTVNLCSDDSSDYFVEVQRAAGAAVSCDQYTLTVTNGL